MSNKNEYQALVKKPFYFQQVFIGKLFNESYCVENIQVYIDYSEIYPSQIHGYIVGNKEKYEEIEKLFHLKSGFFKFESYDMEDRYERLLSNKVLFNSIKTYGWPDEIQNHFNSIISYLTFLEIETFLIRPSSVDFQEVNFCLNTNYNNLGGFFLPTLHYDGNITVKESEIELNLNQKPYRIYICNRSFFNNENNALSTVSIGALRIKAPIDIDSNEFIKMSLNLAEDVLMLFSFVREKNLVWFYYNYFGINGFKRYVKSFFNRKGESKQLDDFKYDDSFLYRGDATRFVEKCFINYRRLNEQGLNLKLPIIELNMGKHVKTINEQFILYFLGIEKIVDLTVKDRKIVSDKEFKKLHKKIYKCIDDYFKDKNEDARIQIKKKKIIEKLPELNRPAFKSLLFELFENLKIDNKSFYPKNGAFTLIKTRDKLFHTKVEPEMEMFEKENIRARSILENLILKLLGWDECFHSPRTWEKKLIKNSESEWQ